MMDINESIETKFDWKPNCWYDREEYTEFYYKGGWCKYLQNVNDGFLIWHS